LIEEKQKKTNLKREEYKKYYIPGRRIGSTPF
jgi:hypothetical protein